MKKRLLCLILVLMNVLSFAVYAEDGTGLYTDEFKSLSDYGIMTAGSDEAMSKPVTQGQFRNAILNIAGDDTMLAERADSFGETYDPNGSVTFIKAVISLVKLIGYDNPAIQLGGTNNEGYIKTARSNGILKGVKSIDPNTEITYAEAGKLIYNTLKAPLVTVSFENGGYTYKVDNDKNLITEKLSFYKVTGTVNATCLYAMPGYSKTQETTIVIGDSEYKISQQNMINYFGMNVTAYYKYNEDEDSSTIVRIEERYADAAICLEPDSVENFNKDGRYDYLNDAGKDKTANIEKDAAYFYNYEYLETKSQIDNAVFVPDTGTVTLIDNDNNGKYDVVLILNYEVRVVETAKDDSVYSKFGESAVDSKSAEIRDTNGTKYDDTSFLSEGDVIQVIFDDDGETAKYITVGGSTIEGKITYVRTSGNEPIIKISDGNEYRIPQSKLSLAVILDTSMNIAMYLNMNGDFAGYKIIKSTDYVFGYMIDLKVIDSEETGEPTVFVKLYDLNERKILKLNCRKKFKADDDTIDVGGYEEFVNGKYEYKDGQKWRVWDQLIRYKKNSDGLITNLDFAPNATKFGLGDANPMPNNEKGLYKILGSQLKMDTGDKNVMAEAAKDPTRSRLFFWKIETLIHQRYIKNGTSVPEEERMNTWLTSLPLNSTMIGLYVPQDRNSEDAYRVTTAKDYTAPESQVVLDAFRVGSETYNASIIVFYENDGAPVEDSSSGVVNNTQLIPVEAESYIISDIEHMYLEDKDISTYKLMVLGGKSGEEKVLYTKNEDWMDALKFETGDVIRFAANGDMLEAVEKMVSLDDIKDYKNTDFKKFTGSTFGTHGQIIGYCYAQYDDLRFVTTDPANISAPNWKTGTMFAVDNSMPVFEFDCKKKKVTKSDYSCMNWYNNTGSIEKTSAVYIHCKTAGQLVMFVFNNLFD